MGMGFELGASSGVKTHASFTNHVALGKACRPWVSFVIFKSDLTRLNSQVWGHRGVILASQLTAARGIFYKHLLDNGSFLL